MNDQQTANEAANARANDLEDKTAAWVRKLNRIAFEIDEIWDGTHPAVAEALTAELSKKYRALSADIRAVPNDGD